MNESQQIRIWTLEVSYKFDIVRCVNIDGANPYGIAGRRIVETDPVWTIDCHPKDVSEVFKAAEEIYNEFLVKHVTIYWNWTDPEWDEDMIDVIWYDGTPRKEQS